MSSGEEAKIVTMKNCGDEGDGKGGPITTARVKEPTDDEAHQRDGFCPCKSTIFVKNTKF